MKPLSSMMKAWEITIEGEEPEANPDAEIEPGTDRRRPSRIAVYMTLSMQYLFFIYKRIL